MSDRYERGLARQAELGGPGDTRKKVYDALADIAPDLHGSRSNSPTATSTPGLGEIPQPKTAVSRVPPGRPPA